MLAVAVPKRNKLQNIIVLTPKDGNAAESLFPQRAVTAVKAAAGVNVSFKLQKNLDSSHEK